MVLIVEEGLDDHVPIIWFGSELEGFNVRVKGTYFDSGMLLLRVLRGGRTQREGLNFGLVDQD